MLFERNYLSLYVKVVNMIRDLRYMQIMNNVLVSDQVALILNGWRWRKIVVDDLSDQVLFVNKCQSQLIVINYISSCVDKN